MMNNIYDFDQISTVRVRKNKLIFYYILYVLCFAVGLIFACIVVENNVLLTAVFACLLLLFSFFSVLFWKIKYGVLKEYLSFLEQLETGKQDDYVGVFVRKVSSKGGTESFDIYTFTSNYKETDFLIYDQHSVCFEKEHKYHIVNVGKYVYQWKNIE